jgi:hypothetical protein
MNISGSELPLDAKVTEAIETLTQFMGELRIHGTKEQEGRFEDLLTRVICASLDMGYEHGCKDARREVITNDKRH